MRKYGWIKNQDNGSIKKYSESKFFNLAPLPPMVDLRSVDSPILDQGQLGACTGYGITGCINFLQKGFLGSAIFVYYNERAAEGTVNQDSGANIQDGINSVVTQGICSQDVWPNDDTHFTVQPSPEAYSAALKDVVTDYLALNTLEDMKNCLATGFPFVFGVTLYESFESQAVASTGIVPMPHATETVLGGHCMKAIGYDDNNQWFIVANSWSTAWGVEGYCFIPYNFVQKYGSDFATIRNDSGQSV